jgi:hypothetical protein
MVQARVRGCTVGEFENLVAQGLQKLPGNIVLDKLLLLHLPRFSGLMAEVLQLNTDSIEAAASLASRVSAMSRCRMRPVQRDECSGARGFYTFSGRA